MQYCAHRARQTVELLLLEAPLEFSPPNSPDRSKSVLLRRRHISADTSKLETSGGPYARSLQTRCLNQPFAINTVFGKRAVRCSAPATWNCLPRTVTDRDTLQTFKSDLKTFLFCQAFNDITFRQLL